MPGPAGRDQRGPMERLTRLLFVLSSAGAIGVPADRLVAAAAYGATESADRRDQLRRDLRHLAGLGWEIARTSGEGEEARYRLTAVDNRLRLVFADRQRFELLRAARVAGLGALAADLATGDRAAAGDEDRDASSGGGRDASSGGERVESSPTEVGPLDVVQRAVHRHCLLRFEYKGRPRLLHPYGLYSRTAGWYLTGRPDGEDLVKTFAVARMSHATIDAPGTADRPASPVRPRLDPVSWLVDEPIMAVLATTAEHASRVVDLLGAPVATEGASGDEPEGRGAARGAGTGSGTGTGTDMSVDVGADASAGTGVTVGVGAGELRLTIEVTNRSAFRARLYELGARARLLGPEELRDEVRAELTAVATGRSA